MQTITEALAEIATIDKRIPKKAADLVPYVARPEQVKDPMAAHGGSEQYIGEQRQSFSDLLKRKVLLRALIAKANAETELTLGTVTQSVADWLVWKRECYAHQLDMLRKLLAQAQGARAHAQQNGLAVIRTGEGKPDDVVISVDERELVDEIDALEETYGRLDGLLSLKNATTTIE